MKKVVLFGLTAAMLSLPMMANADATMTKVAEFDDADWIYDSTLLRVRSNNGYAIADVDGNVLTDAIYSSSMDQEYRFITASENREGMDTEGVLNMDGSVLVPFKYGDVKVVGTNWIEAFTLVLADANNYDYEDWSSDNYYLIDTVDFYYVADGAAQATLVGTLPRTNFKDSDAFGAYINIEDRATGTVNTYDSSFTVIGQVDYTWDTEGLDIGGYTKFRENGQYGIMAADGSIVMPASFQYVADERYGYFEVSTGEKDGLVDLQGNLVVPAEYDSVQTSWNGVYDMERDSTSAYCNNGYFAVVADGKLGFVGANAEVTCEPKYAKDVMDVSGCSAIVTDLTGNQLIIAADGVESTVSGFDSVRVLNYSGGLYYVVTDSDYNHGLIDWHGEEIIPCEMNDIDLSSDGKYLLISKDYNSPTEIYALTNEAVAAPTEAAPADAAPADAAPADAAPAGDNSAAVAMLDAATAVLAADTPEARASAVSVLNSALAMMDSSSTAATLLNTAVAQLQTEGSDISGILSLITTAKTMF